MSPKRFFKKAKKNTSENEKKNQSPSNSLAIPASVKASAFGSTKSAYGQTQSAGKAERFNLSMPKINPVKLFKLYGGILKVLVVFTFIAAVIVVGLDLQKNLQTKQSIDSQRNALTKELSFWEDFTAKHQNYRDAYFQASILEYKLGDTSKAKMYIEKGLSLDPNSENGKKLEQFLMNK